MRLDVVFALPQALLLQRFGHHVGHVVRWRWDGFQSGFAMNGSDDEMVMGKQLSSAALRKIYVCRYGCIYYVHNTFVWVVIECWLLFRWQIG